MVATLAVVGASDARAEAVWRFAPAQPPPPPEGVAPAPYPVPVGEVGDISFWAPNRGLLITGGTEGPLKGPVAAGLYAYDGSGWHQLATVCGGAEGRIAWVGPDEFWTISDQRPGQVLPPGGRAGLQSISLCHFRDGEVVGSYAMPLEEPDSYLHMNAAACRGPSDCWFGGQDGVTPNVGAFHLHWDGSTVTRVYEPEDHTVTGMVDFAGELYESVQIDSHDAFLSSEQPEHPAVLHAIVPGGATPIFEDVATFSQAEHKRLPEYGKGVQPGALQGFDLATDGAPPGVGATQLWAAANPLVEPPPGSNPASLTVLRLLAGSSENVWSQITPQLAPGVRLAGALTQIGGKARESGTSGAIAPEPGGAGAWMSLRAEGTRGAMVAHLQAGGQVDRSEVLPTAGEPVGYRGGAGPIACPAPHDCWLATAAEAGATSGWLFHLTDGTQLARDTDPFFDGQDPVIASRPSDGGVPVVYPDLPPVDNSLANQQPPVAPTGPPIQTPAPARHKQAKRLVEHVKSRFLHRRELVVSFTLTARAHVQLLGRRGHRIVASTPRQSLKPGRHELSLRLDPASWPTAMQFKATPIGVPAPAEAGSGAGDTIGT